MLRCLFTMACVHDTGVGSRVLAPSPTNARPHLYGGPQGHPKGQDVRGTPV